MELEPNHYLVFVNEIAEHRWMKLSKPDQEFSDVIRCEFYENAYHPLEGEANVLEWYNIIYGIHIPYNARAINTYLAESAPKPGTYFVRILNTRVRDPKVYSKSVKDLQR